MGGDGAYGHLAVGELAAGFVGQLDDQLEVGREIDGAVRCELAAAILARFWSLYQHMDDPKLHDEYRRRCFLLGQPLIVRQGASRVRARAVDLTPDFKLVIELPDKTRRALPYGEVSTGRA